MFSVNLVKIGSEAWTLEMDTDIQIDNITLRTERNFIKFNFIAKIT